MISLVVLLIAARMVASTASDGSGSEDAETALPDLKTAMDTCADLVDEHGNWLTAIEACIWVLTYDGGGHLLLGVETAGDRARAGLHLLSGLHLSLLPQQHKVTWLYDVQAARARWPSEVDGKLLSPSVRRHASVYPRRPIPAPGADLVASSHPSLPPPPSQTLIVLRRGTFSVVDRRHGRISRSPTICGTQVSSGNHLASNPPAFKKSKNLELTHPYYPPLPWPRRRPHRRQQPKRSGSSALLPLAGRRRERRDRQKARGAWDGAQGACHGRRQPLGPPSGGPPKPPWVRKCVFTTCTVRESVYHVHTCIIRPCNTR